MGKTDGCKIWLYTGRVNEWLNMMERQLTDIGDKMDIVETGLEMLTGYWDSPAQRLWRAGLAARMERIRNCTERMDRLFLSLNKIAGMLAETEKKNNNLIDSMAGGG